MEKATHDAGRWDDVCEEISLLLGATGTLLPDSNPNFRGLWTAGTKRIKEALAEYLNKKWIKGDAREPVLKIMFERGICTDDEVYPDRAARLEMPIYRDFLNPWNFGNVCMVRLLTPEGYWPMAVHFANDHPPLQDEDFALIQKIQSLFERATKEASELAHHRIFEFSKFLSGSKSDVFLFDADGQRSFTIDRNGRMITRDRLDRLLPSKISMALQSELKDVLISDPDMSLSKSYRFVQGEKNVSVLVIQIPPSLRHFFMKFKTCAIRTECSESNIMRNIRLRDEYNLSEAEVTTVELLSSGKTPIAIADMLGLKPSSVRQRLKLIYDKVDVKSQVELIASYTRM
ncbi:helix-turn-helix transcriptional regulator [Celeribacter baekdonensis]|uniref:helix-turn-helix transcriptional regulator n=1 Tax=Celeribacter baekdonensis TaxID=875171 RepID=UPI003A9400BB